MSGVKILMVWIMILIIWFALGISYFILYEAMNLPMTMMFDITTANYVAGDTTYDPGNFANRLGAYWKFSHIIIAAGTLVWGILVSTRKEEHVYQRF